MDWVDELTDLFETMHLHIPVQCLLKEKPEILNIFLFIQFILIHSRFIYPEAKTCSLWYV